MNVETLAPKFQGAIAPQGEKPAFQGQPGLLTQPQPQFGGWFERKPSTPTEEVVYYTKKAQEVEAEANKEAEGVILHAQKDTEDEHARAGQLQQEAAELIKQVQAKLKQAGEEIQIAGGILSNANTQAARIREKGQREKTRFLELAQKAQEKIAANQAALERRSSELAQQLQDSTTGLAEFAQNLAKSLTAPQADKGGEGEEK